MVCIFLIIAIIFTIRIIKLKMKKKTPQSCTSTILESDLPKPKEDFAFEFLGSYSEQQEK